MHFIQNNWFSINFLWVVLFFVCAILIIAYINNKEHLFKKTLLSFFSIFFITIFISFFSPNYIVNQHQQLSINNKQIEEVTSSTSSGLFAKTIDLVMNVFFSKLNDRN